MPDEPTLAVGQIWMPPTKRTPSRKISGIGPNHVSWRKIPTFQTGQTWPSDFCAWIKRTGAKLEGSE